MKSITGRNHTTMKKTFWKALACGIAIKTLSVMPLIYEFCLYIM